VVGGSFLNIPSKINQGDSVSWSDNETRDNLGNTIDSSWTLTYSLRGPTILDKAAITNGNGWQTLLTITETAALSAGIYYWQAVATKNTSRVTVGSGSVEVLKNISTVSSGAYDGRSQIQKDLDAVNEAIRSLVGNGAVQEYSIGNRSFKKMTISELRELRSSLKYELNKEQRDEKMKNGESDPFTLKVRF
jgi:hypothetical protein